MGCSAFFCASILPSHHSISVAIGHGRRSALPCRFNQLHAPATIFDAGLKTVRFNRTRGGLVHQQIHVRFDGHPAIISTSEKIRANLGKSGITLHWKGVVQFGEEADAVRHMVVFLHICVFDEGLDLAVEFPAVLFTIRWWARALIRKHRVAGIENQGEPVLNLMPVGSLQVTPMISAVFPWRQAVQACDLLQENAIEDLGVLLDWNASS